jgi:hypothetical protein
MPSPSRGADSVRVVHDHSPAKQRAQGTPGAQCTRSLTCKSKKARKDSHHRFAGTFRRSLRNGLTAYSELSPVTGFLATVASRRIPRSLTSASGCQDHTALPYAKAPSVNTQLRARRCRVHRTPHPTSVTIAKRPSDGCGMARFVELIWVGREGIYFSRRDWTGSITLIWLHEIPGMRRKIPVHLRRARRQSGT